MKMPAIPASGRSMDEASHLNPREITRAGIIFILLNLVFFSVFIFSPSRMPYWESSDAIRILLVWKQFTLSSLRNNGEFPLWLPYIWSGATFIGDIHSQFFYPFGIPFFFIEAKYYFAYYMFVHVVLAGLFMYCLARVLGMRRYCASVAALIYMYGGYSSVFWHFQQLSFVVCWIPALFLSVEMLLRKKSASWAIISGLVMAIFFLGTHPQLFYYSMLTIAAYFICRIAAERAEALKLAGLGAFACLVFAGSAAPALLPALESAGFSPRGGGISLYHATYQSLQLQSLPLFFLPRSLGGDFTCHEGLVAFFLVVPCLLGRRNHLKLFFLGAALGSLIVALGRYTPVYMLLFKFLPGFGLFRAPDRALVIFSVSIPLLCGFGLGDLINAIKDADTRARLISSLKIFLAATLACALLVKILFGPGRQMLLSLAQSLYQMHGYSLPFEAHRGQVVALLDELSSSLMILLSLALASGGLLWGILRIPIRRYQALSLAFAALILAETWHFALPGFKTIEPSGLYGKNELVGFLEGHEGEYRVLNMGGERILPQYLAAPCSIELADGYSPVITYMYLRYTNRIAGIDLAAPVTKLPLTDLPIERIERPALLSLLNVRYVLSEKPGDNPALHKVKEFENVPVYRQGKGIILIPRVIVYENASCMPRAFLVPKLKVCRTEEECLDLLDKIDPRETILSCEGAESSGAGTGVVKTIIRTPNYLEFEVATSAPSHLLLSETWYPGWKAWDNGKETKVGRANYIFRYLSVGAGQHRITMRYQPLMFSIGKRLGAATIICVLAYLIITATTRRLRSPSSFN